MKKWISLALALLLAAALALPAYAAGSVSYDGDARKFIFAPGTEESLTNLFPDFRNVMPGDTLTEQVTVKNDSANGVKIVVYMRALGAAAGSEDFLSQLNLTVRQADDSILFQAPADKTAQLTDWVCLGTVYSGGEITLEVTLEVPVTLDNAFQNSVGYLDWQFKVEELPVEPGDPQPPQTGDGADPGVYAGVMALSLAVMAVLLAANRRKKDSGK